MNTVTLPAADLKQALPGLSKSFSARSHLPVLQSVRLTRTLAGVVTLAATDLDRSQLQPRTIAAWPAIDVLSRLSS